MNKSAEQIWKNDMTNSCTECVSVEDLGMVVECAKCPNWAHISCLNPPLPKLPGTDEFWVCENCEGPKNKRRNCLQMKQWRIYKKKRSDRKKSPQTAVKKGYNTSNSSHAQGDQEDVTALKKDLGRNEIKLELLNTLDLISYESVDENAEGLESESYDRKSEDEEKTEKENKNKMEKFEEAQRKEIEEFQASKKCELQSEIQRITEEKKKEIERINIEIDEVNTRKSLEAEKEIEEFLRLKKKEAIMFKTELRQMEKLAEIEDLKAKTASLVKRRDEMNQEIESRNKKLKNLEDAMKEDELNNNNVTE